MSDKNIFTNLKDYQQVFDNVITGRDTDMDSVLRLMRQANAENAEWPNDFRSVFEKNLSAIAEKWNTKKLDSTGLQLLRSALDAGFDTPALRAKYAVMAKKSFSSYKDGETLVKVLGIEDSNVSLHDFEARWQMMGEIKQGAICYDQEYRRGQILALDDAKNEVQFSLLERRRSIPLEDFLDKFIVVCDMSDLHTIILGGLRPVRREGKDLFRDLSRCLSAGHPLPEDALERILVPDVVDASYYKAQIKGIVESRSLGANGENANQVEDRWDESRTISELAGRLKNWEKGSEAASGASLTIQGDEQKVNVLSILKNGKDREDQASDFALAIALIIKNANDELKEWVNSIAADLKDAAVWQNIDTCAEVSMEIPGKSVQYWFNYSLLTAGADFLAKMAMKLPYRLWGYVEKSLKTCNEQTRIAAEVQAILTSGHASSDLLYWLWRSNQTEMKEKYLADATLIFRTLHQECKGDFLKAQRDLRRLLLENGDFQEQVMNNGERSCTLDLIRCTKRYPLLDPGEIQSLLVKIVELHPDYLSDVEEKRKGPMKITIGRLTSIRGYNQRKAELENLVNVEIPENTKALEHARSLGDLRENSEFKYAKERQGLLGKRRREWEDSLNGMKTTDFRDIKVDDVAIPGCAVTFTYSDKTAETYYILGLLDSETEKHIISYDTPLGKTLMGTSVGTKVTLPNGSKVVISAISRLPDELYDYVADKKK